MSQDRSKIRWNGWGWVAHKDQVAQREELWTWLAGELGMPALLATPPRPLEGITLPPSKLVLQDRLELSGIVGSDQLRDSTEERAFHALGRSYRDLLRLRSGDLSTVPDAVVYPRSAGEVEAVLAHAVKREIAVVPFGGGTSVVGGVTAARGDFPAVLTLDLSDMDRVIAVDPIACTATAEAGIYGPMLEEALKLKGLTLGHLPQSFEFSTLGGWIAHNGAGHSSHLYGRPRDWLVSAKLATPQGLLDTGAAPASAAGPELKTLIAGSEGIFGIITEATLRLKRVPQVSQYRGYLFRDFASGTAALRTAQQDGCGGATLRLSDDEETRFFRNYAAVGKAPRTLDRLVETYLKTRGFADRPCVLIAGFEGDAKSAAFQKKRFESIARRYGVLAAGRSPGERWRQSRFQAPYLRDSLLDRGVGVDTIETAASWSRLATVYEAVRITLETVIRETAPREGAHGIVMGHISHAYTDGACLYFTYLFPRAIGNDLEQCDKIRKAALDTVLMSGGTLSHHHGVGEDNKSWLTQEKSDAALSLYRAVKTALDPAGILNPGKLLS